MIGSNDSEREAASSAEAEITEEAAPIPSEEPEAEETDVQSLREALAKEKEQAERYLANWQRAQADLINYRKRVAQEQEDLAKYAGVMVIMGLVQILDDFDRALASTPPKLMGLTWVEGIFLLQRKLQSILEAQGLSETKALGEDFDPSLHEAVLYGEGEEGKVVEELQKGYKLHDRVIRPAMVQVGKGTEKQNEDLDKTLDSE